MENEERNPKSRSREAFKERMKEKIEAAAEKKDGDGKKLPWKAVAVGAVGIAALCVGVYVYKGSLYQNTYLPNTVINGVKADGKTPEEIRTMVQEMASDYQLKLLFREGQEGVLEGRQFNLQTEFDGSLEEIIRQQNPYAWPRYIIKGPEYDLETMINYDHEAFEKALKALEPFREEQARKPQNASISDYIEGEGYAIVPEDQGTLLSWDASLKAAEHAMMELKPELDMDAEGCYEQPEILADDPTLLAELDRKNRYVSMTVTYVFGNEREVLNGDEIHQWIIEDGEQVLFNDEKISAYVDELASKYNTAYKKRTFRTSYGKDVEVSGVYGWKIDQKAEAEALKAVLAAGESVEREPVYSQTAVSHDENDYGNTYAEVNLTAQHLFFYENGQKVMESDFVSGNLSRGYTTPPGLFSLTYKQKDAVLRGQGYASPVKFWMPFNGGIGFHDASWRSTFGGKIYRTNGSHGCINMPYEAAKTLFEKVYKGMPVICYNLDGTESEKATNASGKPAGAAVPAAAPAPAPPQETPAAPPETVPETLPAETQSEPEPTEPAEIGPGVTATTAPAQPEIGPGVTAVPSETTAEQPAPAQTEAAPAPQETAPPAQDTTPVPQETSQASDQSGPVIQPVSETSQTGGYGPGF